MQTQAQQFFFALMSMPYTDDTTTSLLRLTEAALRQGHRVLVWACGGATGLTSATLGEWKPRNLGQLDQRYPSTAQLIGTLLEQHPDRLRWCVCRHCMEEHGTTVQIKQVQVKPPVRFLHYHEQASVRLILGRLR